MRIRPRKQILDIWRSLLAECYRDQRWSWGGQVDESKPDEDQLFECGWTRGIAKDARKIVEYTADYSPLIIKRSLQAAQLTDDVEARESLMAVAEAAMDHLDERRLTRGEESVELWDDVSHLPGMQAYAFDRPSWYLTERVVEALVATATAYEREPPRSSRMYDHLLRLLNEADHVYNQELMRSNVDDQSVLRDRLREIGQLIERVRETAQPPYQHRDRAVRAGAAPAGRPGASRSGRGAEPLDADLLLL